MKYLLIFSFWGSIFSCKEKQNSTRVEFLLSVKQKLKNLKPSFCIGNLEKSKTLAFVASKESIVEGRTLLDSIFQKSNLYVDDTLQIKYATIIYPESTFNHFNSPVKNKSIVWLYDIKANCIKDSFSIKTNGTISFYYKEIADSVYKRLGTLNELQ